MGKAEDKGARPLDELRLEVIEQLSDAIERKLPEDTMHLSAAARNVDALARQERAESSGSVPPGMLGEVRAAVWAAGQECELATGQSDALVAAFDTELRKRLGAAGV